MSNPYANNPYLHQAHRVHLHALHQEMAGRNSRIPVAPPQVQAPPAASESQLFEMAGRICANLFQSKQTLNAVGQSIEKMKATLAASEPSTVEAAAPAETAWTAQDEELFGLFQLNRACFDPKSDLAKRMAQRPAPQEVARLLAAEAKPGVDQAPQNNAWTLQDEDLIGLFDAKRFDEGSDWAKTIRQHSTPFQVDQAEGEQSQDLAADDDLMKLAQADGYPVRS